MHTLARLWNLPGRGAAEAVSFLTATFFFAAYSYLRVRRVDVSAPRTATSPHSVLALEAPFQHSKVVPKEKRWS